jgi:hypothetical protein
MPPTKQKRETVGLASGFNYVLSTRLSVANGNHSSEAVIIDDGKIKAGRSYLVHVLVDNPNRLVLT